LLGDLMLGRGVNPGTDSLAYLIPSLSTADLALANLESPFATILPASDSSYNLCVSSALADLPSIWGFDMVSIANNHNLDCGSLGIAETISVLGKTGIATVGSSMQPYYREVNGLHLAFFAFDDATSPLDKRAAVQAIRSAHLTGSIVIVSIHWGAEYQRGASERQKSLAKEISEAGAALIWGHHPHVLQPAAWLGPQPCDGSNPSHGCTLVLYSLGNALFDQGGLEDTRLSALVIVTLDSKGVIGVQTDPFGIDVINSRIFKPDQKTAENIQNWMNLP